MAKSVNSMVFPVLLTAVCVFSGFREGPVRHARGAHRWRLAGTRIPRLFRLYQISSFCPVSGLASYQTLWHVPPHFRGCRGSGVEHPLGKGEVESSNLSGSTIVFPGFLRVCKHHIPPAPFKNVTLIGRTKHDSAQLGVQNSCSEFVECSYPMRSVGELSLPNFAIAAFTTSPICGAAK